MINWFKKHNRASNPQNKAGWMEALQEPTDAHTLSYLRNQLIRYLKPALAKYIDHDLHDFTEDIVQDALLKIMDNLNTFRGDSAFMTWATSIAVREGLTELRKKRYENISWQDLTHLQTKQLLSKTSTHPSPARQSHENHLVELTLTMINEELTRKQREVMTALVIKQVPITVVADRLNMSRNALYKMVHDARKKLKSKLKEKGYDSADLFYGT
ncbi:MAG: RNA polymerase sigma factor [Bacteroidota bacterium]